MGAARAFEKRPGQISPIFTAARFVSNEQFSFDKHAAKLLPLLKASRG
jgi:hypothetical protein